MFDKLVPYYINYSFTCKVINKSTTIRKTIDYISVDYNNFYKDYNNIYYNLISNSELNISNNETALDIAAKK